MWKWRENQRKVCALWVKEISSIKETQNKNLNSPTINLLQSPQESSDLPKEWGGETSRMEELYVTLK